MAAPFLGPDFLLDTPASRRLYHEVASTLPIVDFHNHLDPSAIAEDRNWDSIGEIWLEGDHYKWRAMRWNGIPESLVTGSAPFREKFNAFAETIPHCLGNPLYHWTHLELRRYFGWEGVFGPETADEVWELANDQLANPSHSARGLLRSMNVSYVGTTDDPCDDLSFHASAQNDADLTFKMAPSFRPDKTLVPSDAGFAAYCRRLEIASDHAISRFDDLIEALLKRLDHFITLGCKASDHALNEIRPFSIRARSDLDAILKRGMESGPVSVQDEAGDCPPIGHDHGDVQKHNEERQGRRGERVNVVADPEFLEPGAKIDDNDRCAGDAKQPPIKLPRCAILDGGIKAWLDSRLPLTTQPVTPEPSGIRTTFSTQWLATRDEVKAISGGYAAGTLVDARPDVFLSGKKKHAAAKKAGTIPNARQFQFTQWFDGQKATVGGGLLARFRKPDGEGPVVSFCNTGHWAATNWFMMSEVQGVEGVKLYPESMVGWTKAGEAVATQ